MSKEFQEVVVYREVTKQIEVERGTLYSGARPWHKAPKALLSVSPGASQSSLTVVVRPVGGSAVLNPEAPVQGAPEKGGEL